MTPLDVLLLFALGLAIALLYACNEDRKDYRDNYYSVCRKLSNEQHELSCANADKDELKSKIDDIFLVLQEMKSCVEAAELMITLNKRKQA